MAPQDPRSIRTRLRHATRALHADLERAMPLSCGVISLPAYRDHLSFLLSFHSVFESDLGRVEQLRTIIPDLDLRWKTSALEADVGLASDQGRQPPCRLVPQNVAQALGMLYVLEGAMLGGQLLLRQLRTHGIVPGPVGCSYLQIYGESAGEQWRSFCVALEGVSPDLAPEMERWARGTFARVLAWRRSWQSGIDGHG